MGNVNLFGRQVILSDAPEITRGNVLDELAASMQYHTVNSAQIDYLYRYYTGEQDILQRVKEIRPEICNKIVVNIANEIVTFKTSYQCGSPIQYISTSKDEDTTEDVSLLNKLMTIEGKEAKDQQLFDWMFIAGLGYRFVKPRSNPTEDEAPFMICVPDPRTCYVVYSSDIERKPLFAVKYRKDPETVQNPHTLYSVYTKDKLFTIQDDDIIKEESHTYGDIPIIEYPANSARLGSFELVKSMLDAINTVESNRVDGIEQNIQAFLKFINCEVDEDQMTQLRYLGAIMIKSANGQEADVDSVKTDIDQNQTQTTKDDLYQTILTICGMPNRNGGSSTSDTGAAVEMRDGFTAAEARAKAVEAMYNTSERKMLKLVLKFMRELSDAGQLYGMSDGNKFDLRLIDTDIKATRRNYENIQSKAQVLTEMLDNEKIHPQLAFQHCGMFPDPESAYKMSEEYHKEYMESEAKRIDQLTGVNGGDDDANADTANV